MSYVMESAREGQRLQAQAVSDPVEPRVRASGLREGARALDLGCGPGVTTLAMARVVGPHGHVVGVDRSAARIADAQRAAAHEGVRQVEFFEADAFRLPFEGASFDFCWSQFVFEYFRDRATPLAELFRVTRPGGTVAIADVDQSGVLNWPFPEHLAAGLQKVIAALESTGFDPQVGRKLYSEMRAAGFTQVTVRLEPHYLHAGAADARSLEDWRTRFVALEPLVAPKFSGAAAYREFAEEFVRYWAAPDALKYSVLLVTQGTRP